MVATARKPLGVGTNFGGVGEERVESSLDLWGNCVVGHDFVTSRNQGYEKAELWSRQVCLDGFSGQAVLDRDNEATTIISCDQLSIGTEEDHIDHRSCLSTSLQSLTEGR